MTKVLVIHGANLNLLGKREPELYGNTNLNKLDQALIDKSGVEGIALTTYQSNSEHEIIDRLHQAFDQKVDYIIINPGAFTHTSIAIRDALLGIAIPFIEVHITNIYSRESFRHTSYLSDIALGQITGLGTFGYLLALDAIINKEKEST